MASNSDKFVLEDALATGDNDVFFNQKKWNYIVDATSNAGVFTNQIQFNLNTLASQGQWVNLSEAYIQFPIRVRIYNSGSASQTPEEVNINSTVLKNGFHHMVDSVSIVLDNTNIQMNQNFENVNATFKILTEWDPNTLAQLGPTLGLSALDDFPSFGVGAGLNNLPVSTLVPNPRGFDLSMTANTAIPLRQYEQNIDIATSTTTLNSIVGAANAINIGKSSVQVAGGAVAPAGDAYLQYVLATVRLSDLSDSISKLPPIKNLKGFVYVNYNGSAVQFSTVSADLGFIKGWSYSSIQGRSTPVMIQNNASAFQPATGASNTWTLECTVSGAPPSGTALTSAKPPINYARLVAPYYGANPEIDSALSQTKKIYYNERFINNFTVQANTSFNGTITPGIVNPKRLILVPYFNLSSATVGTQTLTNIQPYQSPFETAPATTSVYPVLRNLQVVVGNVPMFLNPINMEYEQFLNEIAQIGIDGGQNNEITSGLINQRQWSQLYRFYTVDISRRLTSEDGSSKGIQISFDNATNLPIQVFAFVWYEKQFTVDTATSSVSK